MDGELRAEVGGQAIRPGPGTAEALPGQLPHAFVVTSPQARFLTVYTPAGFNEFTLAAGAPALSPRLSSLDELPPGPAVLASTAASYGIDILGPRPRLSWPASAAPHSQRHARAEFDVARRQRDFQHIAAGSGNDSGRR